MRYCYNSKKHTADFTDAMKQYVEKTFKSVEKFLKEDENIKFSLQIYGDEELSLKCQVVTSDNKHLLAEVNYSPLIEVGACNCPVVIMDNILPHLVVWLLPKVALHHRHIDIYLYYRNLFRSNCIRY